MRKACGECGKVFITYPSRIKRGEGKYCSNRCADLHRGNAFEKNGNWKGGRYQLKDGYIGVCIGKGRYRREHDVIMEKRIGRKLKWYENVHHINEDKTDNRIENLALLTAGEHARHHHLGSRKTEYVSCRCVGCGKSFDRRKREVELHPNTYCDRDCYKKNANQDSHGFSYQGSFSGMGSRPAAGPTRSRPSAMPTMPTSHGGQRT